MWLISMWCDVCVGEWLCEGCWSEAGAVLWVSKLQVQGAPAVIQELVATQWCLQHLAPHGVWKWWFGLEVWNVKVVLTFVYICSLELYMHIEG